MSRAHVEYLKCQEIALVPLMDNGISTGIRVCELSRDHTTSAVSYYGKISPQWIRRESGYFESACEILVLNGDLHLGNTVISEGHYSYLPAGAVQGPAVSENGCELFLFFDGSSKFVESKQSRSGCLEDLRISALDARRMPWGPPPGHEGRPAEEAPVGLKVKILREDPETRAYTILCWQGPDWSDPDIERHSIWEELILLDGDFLMGRMGKITAGTYIFRDGAIAHGPQVSKKGSVWFARGPAAIDFDYQRVSWANELIEKYLSADHLFDDTSDIGPWGRWRGE